MISMPIREGENYLEVGVGVGNSGNKLLLGIDVEYPYTWVYHQKNMVKFSETLTYSGVSRIDYFNYVLNASYFEEDFKLQNSFQFKFPFFIIEFYLGLQKDSFGFAHKFDSESFSLVHRLHSLSLIKKKLFVLDFDYRRGFDPSTAQGFLYLGKNKKNSFGYSEEIQVDKKEKKWCAHLSEISFENKRLEINKNFVFRTTSGPIRVPSELFEELYKNIFEKLEKYNCTYNIYSSSSEYGRGEHIESCKCRSLEEYMRIKIPDFTFDFNGTRVVLTKDDLLRRREGTCTFIFQGVSGDPKFQWELGKDFLSLFNTEFNYEKDTIRLSSSVVEIFSCKSKYMKIAMVTVSLVMGINIFILILIELFLNNKKQLIKS